MSREWVCFAVLVLVVLAVGCSSSVDSEQLSGTRVAVLIGEGMYSTGAVDPSSYLRARGASVRTVGLDTAAVAPYDTPQRHMRVNELIAEADAGDYDALVIPGGAIPPIFGDRMASQPEVIRFVREMVDAGRVVAAVCTGVNVLIQAGVVSGRNMTGPEPYADRATASGATWVGGRAVRDANLVTGGPAECLEGFSEAVFEAILETK